NAYLAHKGKPPVAMEETLPPRLRAAGRLAFGMRLTAGVPTAWLRGRWKQTAQRLVADGLAQWEGDRFRPTERGILFADSVAAEFVA
ncbi:MAG: coproporphyrinogen III oxidase, partial [Verrucomicrobiae bacterium]|nr:coproporphyrinogen III oxidase [Verrucomicrobiae bacterium]